MKNETIISYGQNKQYLNLSLSSYIKNKNLTIFTYFEYFKNIFLRTTFLFIEKLEQIFSEQREIII